MGEPILNSRAGDLVDFFRFDCDLAFEFGRHFRERGGVDFYSGLLHAGEHGNQREIDFFVELGESCLLHFFAQSGGQPAGYVGGFGKIAAEFQIEAAEGDIGAGDARSTWDRAGRNRAWDRAARLAD